MNLRARACVYERIQPRRLLLQAREKLPARDGETIPIDLNVNRRRAKVQGFRKIYPEGWKREGITNIARKVNSSQVSYELSYAHPVVRRSSSVTHSLFDAYVSPR